MPPTAPPNVTSSGVKVVTPMLVSILFVVGDATGRAVALDASRLVIF